MQKDKNTKQNKQKKTPQKTQDYVLLDFHNKETFFKKKKREMQTANVSLPAALLLKLRYF